MKTFVALGKYGDIATALPIIHHYWKQTGKKPDVITSEKYSDIFQGVSYIRKVIIYPGKWADLKGAIKFAKAIYNDVEILQVHGENFPFQQTKPSFQHEVYDRVGLLNEWKNLRPVFDRRDIKRELELMRRFQINGVSEKYILIADQSESSQFKQIEELKLMLNTKFSDRYKVILLSQIKAQKIFDLIVLYENASALVATETVHTHLAWATNVPMFVLSADGWRGSAFRREFQFYSKYADWDRNKNGLMTALEDHLSKRAMMKVETFKTDRAFGYNLASVMFGGRSFYAYRYHSGNWKTKLMICVEGKQFPLMADETIANHSVEDLRLFVFNAKLHGSYTVAAEVQGFWKCYQAYGEITQENGDWRIGHIQIKYPGNDFTGTNKNFVPFVIDDALYFIYGIQGANQVVLQMDYDQVRKAHHGPAPRWNHGEIRGGVILPQGDTLLRFFHSRAVYPDKSFSYFVGCCQMERRPPFKTLMICKAPILAGDDEYFPNCKHWKGRVVFPLGAIQQGDKILLSYGHNDCECRIAELGNLDLNL